MDPNNLPYDLIVESVGYVRHNEDPRDPSSVYGQSCLKLNLNNTRDARYFLKSVVSFCNEETNFMDCSLTTPPTPFVEIPGPILLAAIAEEITATTTNYATKDPNSFYGKLTVRLNIENTRAIRDHLEDLVKARACENFLRNTHSSIMDSFRASSNTSTTTKWANSLFGEVATILKLPNIISVRSTLARWSMHFSFVTQSIATTSNSAVKRRNQRVSIPMNKLPRKRRRIEPQRPENIEKGSHEEPNQLDRYVKEFVKAIHEYPDKVCSFCHKLHYALEIFPSASLSTNILAYIDEVPLTFSICTRCRDNLLKRKLPAQSKYNDMQSPVLPKEIQSLTDPEVQLISQVRPFMKIFYLSKGRGQQALKGSAIHFPNSLKELCQELPLTGATSNFLVVYENIDGLPNQNEFRVRQTAIMEALQWLKRNNWLYKYIEIRERSETSLQPVMMEGEVTNSLNPHKNLPIHMMAYANLSTTKRILRASFHQGTNDRFGEPSLGKQCTAMAMVSIAYSSIQGPMTWTTDTMDEILLRGDKWYRAKSSGGQLLTASEAQGDIDGIFGGAIVSTIADEDSEVCCCGQLNRLANVRIANGSQDEVLQLNAAIDKFIESEVSSAILTVGEYSMALIKYGTSLYFFDSHSRGPHGWTSANGLACIIEFEVNSASTVISQLVHRNLEPKQIPKSNNEMELIHYLFSLTPIRTISEEASERGGSREPSTQPPREADVDKSKDHMANLLQQKNAFGENVMVDSMMHPVDYHVPEIADVIGNQTLTPSIQLQKEKGRPLYPNQEEFLEELSFIKLFPYGRGGLSVDRSVPITPLDYFQARIMSRDTRYWDNSYLFYGLHRMEEHKVKQKIAVCGQMQTTDNNAQGINEYPGLSNVHLYMSAIRGSASYWKKYTGDLIAMNSQCGISTIFLTVSSDDLNSTDSLCGLIFADALRGNGDKELIATLEQQIKSQKFNEIGKTLEHLTYEKKSDLLNRHPVQAARHFDHRTKSFLKLLKNCGKDIFGHDVKDYTYRIEFQNRGSAHIHMLLWLNHIPSDYRSHEGIQLIESNMCCHIPEDDEELKRLVLKYQQHRHTRTCFTKNNYCRFDFPRRVSTETVILEEDDINRNKGRFYILKRTESETYINNYHPKLLKILKCNMDIQFVTDANAIAYYIAKYISKAEPTDLQEEIQTILKQMQSNSSASYHQMATTIAMKIMNKRQVGAPEAAYRMCHLELRHSSRGFVFIPAFMPSKRLHLIRKETIGRENIQIGMCLIDKYCLRPDILRDICLLEFAALYSPTRPSEINETEEEEFTNKKIRLKNGTIMRARRQPAVVKYPNFDPISQMDDYYYALMLLYYPFVTEEDLLDGFPSIVEAFRHRSTHFRNSEQAEFLRPGLAQEIDRALTRVQNFEDLPTYVVEGDDNVPFDLNEFDDNAPEPEELFQPVNDVGNLQDRYRTLSDEQKEVFHKVKAKLDGKEDRQILSFISGAGGTGKSYLIDTLSSLISSYQRNGEHLLLKAAPTGMSALNINATTLHRAFKLPIQRGYIQQYAPLNSKSVEELRSTLKSTKWIIIDEISMVSYQSFRTIHLRLGEITRNESPFGGINVLVLGDLMQFRPIMASWIFKPPSCYLHEINLWKMFEFTELFTNHRQSGDTCYLELLNRLRFGESTIEDLKMLQSRIFDTENSEDATLCGKFADALALFPSKKEVKQFNAEQTSKLREQLAKSNKRTYMMKARDTYATGSKYDQPCPENLIPKDERQTAGIPTDLEIGVGSRIMLIRNWSLTDGLVNGSVGTVKGIKWTALRDEPLQDGDLAEYLIVHFDGDMGGRKKDLNGYVLIECKPVEFIGNRQTPIRRRMFPVVLCWAIVFHKCQGLTLCMASIDLSRSQFAKAMSYVVLSRLKSQEGLQLLRKKLNSKNILTTFKSAPCDDDAVRELYRLRLQKIKVEEKDIDVVLDWILDYPTCVNCKKWVCGDCKC